MGFSRRARALRSMKTRIMVYSDGVGKYKTDVIINDDYLLTTGGFMEKENIINYIKTALQYAQAYLDFLERSSSVDAEMYNLKELRKHLELALADTLAYEVAEDFTI